MRNAELLTNEDFLKAAADKEKCKKASKNARPSTSKSCSRALHEAAPSSDSEIEEIHYDDSEDSEIFSEDTEISNTVNVNFVNRNIPNIQRNVQTEKLYVIGYYDQSKTKLYIGKIKSFDREKSLVLVEFMDQKVNNQFVWKMKPPKEFIMAEQVLIGPLAVNYDRGIYVNGLEKARDMYIKYVIKSQLKI